MPLWRTAVCEVNGINLHYTRTGGNLQPIILLHGLAANGSCWTDVARILEGAYDVIMPDARGHGKSSAPEYEYSYEAQANDVVGLIRALGLSAPTLIGHSMGGLTAAMVAAHNPRLLRGLILADPTFLSLETQREVYESDVTNQHRRFLNMSLNEVVVEARSKHPHRSPELIELLARARLETSINAFDVLRPPMPDYQRLVSLIDVPSLLVISENGVVSSAVAAELQGINSNMQVEKIPQAGHGLHYDQPEQFAGVVKSFLHSLSGEIES